MIRALAPAVLAALAASGASAAPVVGPCAEIANVENLAEPWEDFNALYAGGEIRVALLDTTEPAAAAYHLLVLTPPRNELGLRQCYVVSAAAFEGYATGFGQLDFASRQASYDPAQGLTLTFTVASGLPAEAATLHLTINQATGAITPRLEPQ